MQKNVSLDSEVKALLLGYKWAGNIRELENTMERIVLLSNGELVEADILKSMLPGTANANVSSGMLKATDIERLEAGSIAEALKKCNGVKQKAAKLLGITPRQIDYKMKKYGIS